LSGIKTSPVVERFHLNASALAPDFGVAAVKFFGFAIFRQATACPVPRLAQCTPALGEFALDREPKRVDRAVPIGELGIGDG
jgi:hypothetical protein